MEALDGITNGTIQAKAYPAEPPITSSNLTQHSPRGFGGVGWKGFRRRPFSDCHHFHPSTLHFPSSLPPSKKTPTLATISRQFIVANNSSLVANFISHSIKSNLGVYGAFLPIFYNSASIQLNFKKRWTNHENYLSILYRNGWRALKHIYFINFKLIISFIFLNLFRYKIYI